MKTVVFPALCAAFIGSLLASPLAASEKKPKPTTALCPNGSTLDIKTGKCEEFIHGM